MRIIGLIDPSINSYNLGDQIVMNSINRIMQEEFPNDFFIRIPAYGDGNSRTEEIINKCHFILFCGTGPICSDITFRWPLRRWQYDRKVILMGVGANSYDVKISSEAKRIYESNLMPHAHHGVRDNFTKNVIESAGTHRAINIACPTLWNVTPPNYGKANMALLTLNSSRKDFERDSKLINFIKHYYKDVYFYAQCPNDFLYLKEFKNFERTIIPSNLESINYFLDNYIVDYIGHRLHGGINAIGHINRAFIISVDNRAIEMGKDFNLPVFDISENTDGLKRAIFSKYDIELNLPRDNINYWLEKLREI